MNTINRSTALAKLENIVAQGKSKAAQGMEALEREYHLRRDFMVKPEVIDVEPVIVRGSPGDAAPVQEVKVTGILPATGLSLTRHARAQLLARARIPQTYADELLERGMFDLFRENLRRMLPSVSRDGLLVREVSGVAKGILSPSYRRMDASPIFQGYVQGSLAAGHVPYRGEVTETRAFLSFVETEVREIVPGEFVVFGHELRTSDYGNGGLELNLNVLRLICVNGMTGFDLFRKVHLGRRFEGFGEEGLVVLSQRTVRLDTATVESALRDALHGAPDHFRALEESLRLAAEPGKLSLPAALESLRKQGLKKDTVEKVKALYEQKALPVEAVPQEPSRWRFANVLSLLANEAVGDEAKDLQDASFEALGLTLRKVA